jgi:hypothetical protein
VRFVLDELTGDGFAGILARGLDALLEEADRITLDDAVSRETIQATARTYAVDLTLKGGIPELAGEVARALHAHPIHERVTLGDLLEERRVERLVEHALEFRALRERVVRFLIASPLYEAFASELLYNGIRDYLANGASGIPGARSALELGKAVASRAPGLEATFEEGLLRYIARAVRSVSELTVKPLVDGDHDDALRDVLLDSFRRVRGTTLGELRGDVSADDLEELFVTGYELWNDLRRTELIGTMIDAAVDKLFDKYGESSLLELLTDLGITREIMLGEAYRFAPHAVALLHREGLLERRVRALLAPFYASGAVERVLAARFGDPDVS